MDRWTFCVLALTAMLALSVVPAWSDESWDNGTESAADLDTRGAFAKLAKRLEDEAEKLATDGEDWDFRPRKGSIIVLYGYREHRVGIVVVWPMDSIPLTRGKTASDASTKRALARIMDHARERMASLMPRGESSTREGLLLAGSGVTVYP